MSHCPSKRYSTAIAVLLRTVSATVAAASSLPGLACAERFVTSGGAGGLSAGFSQEAAGRTENQPLPTEEISKRALPAIVKVTAKDSEGSVLATGSGFLVGPGLAVTNLHVIADASAVTITSAKGDEFAVTAVRTDERHDLAILTAPAAASITPLPLGDSAAVAIGQSVVAIGSPRGLDGTVSTGIVSALRERPKGGGDGDGSSVPVLQTTAPISPGSSGGPLLNQRGEVIGVNSFSLTTGQNLNFAIPSAAIVALLKTSETPLVAEGRRVAGGGDAAVAADPNQAILLSLLAQPAFAGPEFEKQVLGGSGVRFELLVVDEGRAYFSLPPAQVTKGQEQASVLKRAARFVADVGQLKMAIRGSNQEWLIDGLMMPATGRVGAVFGTDIANVRLPAGAPFRFPYRRATYTIKASELKGFLDSDVLYGGYLNVDLSPYAQQQRMRSVQMTNRGAYVAIAKEPSLSRLVAELTSGIPAGDTTHRIQRLVDFVTTEINNDYRETTASTELRKNAASVLMTRRGGRDNKAVLLASLLEQVKVNYLLVYSSRQTWVAVPRSGFPSKNGLGFSWEGTAWTLVDVTLPGFKIGSSPVPEKPILKDLRFVQRPKQKNLIVDRLTGTALDFR